MTDVWALMSLLEEHFPYYEHRRVFPRSHAGDPYHAVKRFSEDLVRDGWTPPGDRRVASAGYRGSDPDTSRAAARRIRSGSARSRILVAALGVTDFTCEEIISRASLDKMRSPWKRVTELHQAGLLTVTGGTRQASSGMHQQLYRLTDKGAEVARRVKLLREGQLVKV